MECVQVLTTTDTREEADRLVRSAVDRRLAACGQVVGPISSTYWWNGAIETSSEWHCLFKTTALRLDELVAHVEAEHSYETPEVIATPIVSGSAAYLAWIARETKSG
jgi:periplasmic divalent cation tolerance protein